MRAAHLRLSAHLDVDERGLRAGAHLAAPAFAPRFAIVAALAAAALVVVASLGGLLLPATYARETADWAAQGVGQDWADLVAAPILAGAALLAARGSRRAALVLGGALVYTAYTFAIYAFAVRFNALFLVYCAALGLSLFGLAALVRALADDDPAGWYDDGYPRRAVGGALIGLGALFALLWLADVVPALVRGAPPPSLVAAGLATNPVHVLDLSLVLPLFIAAGASAWRGGALGALAAPILAAFAPIMGGSIAGMMVAMRAQGVAAPLGVAVALGALAVAAAAVLVAALRHVRDR